MASPIFLVFLIGIAGLFYLAREKSIRNSKALWLPVTWIWITGSRPVSTWLGQSPDQSLSQQLLDGSPTDRLVFQALLIAGLIVLWRRGKAVNNLLKASGPVLVFFAYALLSVLWSDYPDVTFKRWIKAIGDVVMVLIVITDAHPATALRRLFCRTGFILVPLSIYMIRWSPMGRGYDPSGEFMNTGVTTNKNTLGQFTFIIGLATVWSLLTLLRSRKFPGRGRQIVAQFTLLAFVVAVLMQAHSATSGMCFTLGTVLMILTGRPQMKRRPSAVHITVLTLAAGVGLFMLFGGTAGLAHALGRNSNLTGRTEIWQVILPMAERPLIGVGFEDFWLGPRLQVVWRAFPMNPVTEAHNGYIEEYLNLGWLGVGLIAWILITAYRRAVAAFRLDPSVGGLMLAYIITPAIFSVTEAGFRPLSPTWVILLLSGIGATTIARGAERVRQQSVTRIGAARVPTGAPVINASIYQPRLDHQHKDIGSRGQTPGRVVRDLNA